MTDNNNNNSDSESDNDDKNNINLHSRDISLNNFTLPPIDSSNNRIFRTWKINPNNKELSISWSSGNFNILDDGNRMNWSNQIWTTGL